ncbi:MAG TPA: hypothetical protein PKE22_08720 [Ottowia sp.]|jgi:hypothetical protein|nr:MAG: hypothetical protein BGO36_07155 [Burkholderiales bacterium 68-10]HMT57374.1 hypothetical protein [Ottowia sp.]HMT64918.1 hypothetical protein [Ottowia sp.]HMT83819.1 hypothetical protein [Ottowia sp.]HOK10647.1 hypothetical protein [Ottowia sp.]
MTRIPGFRAGLIGALLGLAGAATAQVPAIFKDADLKLGEKLIAEHKCNQCHAQKWADDGKAIYRPRGRVNTPGLLRGMIDQCSLELNLSLFPDEVTAIAAVLNRDHYRFKP